jgi:hypothetical protein
MDIQIITEHIHEPVLIVIESVATCEKTALFCKICNEKLTESKTEC